MTKLNSKCKVAIVGAGPSGVYCALWLEKLGNVATDIYEKSSPLKTLLPTGGTRCNLSHHAESISDFVKNYPRGEKFLYSIFSKHFVYDSLDYFNSIGIETYMQSDNRYFPTSNSSSDMRQKMLKALKCSKIIKQNITDIHQLNKYDYIVISTGSKDNYRLASNSGHTIVEPKPALCGLKLAPNSPKYPQGVVLNTHDGEILFTKDGVSGPYIYKISSLKARDNFPYDITVPLIPTENLFQNVKENPKKSFGSIVSGYIPKSLAHVILCDKYSMRCADVKKIQIQNLATITFKVISTDNKGEIVTSGGVSLDEINNFCQSKINEKIFFCGEVMNIDGLCGGYNLQHCWSSAFCAASGIINHLTQRKNL